jgi:hypothetical protein
LTSSIRDLISNPVGRMTMARITKMIIKEAHLGLPPSFFDNALWSGYIAIASIRLHSMMLTKGNMIIRHQPMINNRINNRMVMS